MKQLGNLLGITLEDCLSIFQSVFLEVSNAGKHAHEKDKDKFVHCVVQIVARDTIINNQTTWKSLRNYALRFVYQVLRPT